MATTIDIDGITYSADVDGQTVTISADGVWAGTGRISAGRIVGCAARLGADNETSERVYEEIEDALADAYPVECAADLHELCEALNARPEDVRVHEDDSDLPTFGGTEPESTFGIYSWDTDSFLVPATDNQYRVVSRADYRAED